jgi:hypothetical protein
MKGIASDPHLHGRMFRNRVARTPRAKLENCGDACSRVRPRLLKDRDPLIGGQSAVQGQGGEPGASGRE